MAKKSKLKWLSKFGPGLGLGPVPALAPGIPKDLQRLNENWRTLPRRIQEVILILGRVRPVPRSRIRVAQRHKPGEMAEYLITALNILKESTRYLSDREIARRVGVSASTLSRNETYVKAKRAHMQPFLTIGKRGLRPDAKV